MFNNNTNLPHILNVERAVTNQELDQLERLQSSLYTKPKKIKTPKLPLLSDSEIEDLRSIVSPSSIPFKTELTQEHTDQILTLANQNFIKLTGNFDPAKKLSYAFNPYYKLHQFYNEDAKFCMTLQIKEESGTLKFITDFPNEFLVPTPQGKFKGKSLELGTYWRAMRGKDYSAIPLGGSLIDAISQTFNTNNIITSGFSRFGQLASASARIAPEAVSKVYLRGPLGTRKKQESTVEAYRNLLTPDSPYTYTQIKDRVKEKTTTVKVALDRIVGLAPAVGFESMHKMSDRVVKLPGMMEEHASTDQLVEKHIDKYDKKKKKQALQELGRRLDKVGDDNGITQRTRF